jgi:RNA polymerase sigma factor (TIGR02999 family)
MKESERGEITALLDAWRGGDRSALERLIPLVYGELHRLARSFMRKEREGHTLETRALINEAYLRLFDSPHKWENRAHFYAVAAKAMRHILTDFARARARQKRGGGEAMLSLAKADQLLQADGGVWIEMIALDEAITRLGAIAPRQSQVVELRFFGDLDFAEIAGVLGISTETVRSHWRLGRAWLRRELKHAGNAGNG